MHIQDTYFWYDFPMPDSRWTTEQRGRVLVLRPNRPPRHFFDEQASVELRDHLLAIRRDTSVGAVVFTGQDGTFAGHFDVDTLLNSSRSVPFTVPYPLARAVGAATRIGVRSAAVDRLLRATPARYALLTSRTYECLRLMNRMDKVFVAAIDGMAAGMGLILAMGCDIRLVADADYAIGLPESALGMLAAAGGTQRLTRMVGSGRALDLLLEAGWISPQAAVDIGLMSRLVTADDLLDDALETAARLARRSSRVNREVKRMVYDAGTRPFGRALQMEAASLLATVTSPEAERAMVRYLTALEGQELTDEAITSAWAPLQAGRHVPDPCQN